MGFFSFSSFVRRLFKFPSLSLATIHMYMYTYVVLCNHTMDMYNEKNDYVLCVSMYIADQSQIPAGIT